MFSRRKLLPSEPLAPTLRLAVPADEAALSDLAQLDADRPPRGAVLLAEADGRILAAVSLDDGHGIADPFRPTSELLWRLMRRAHRLRHEHRGRRHELATVWPRMA
jgi:hypothetical protein